jgi:hypothetical protein
LREQRCIFEVTMGQTGTCTESQSIDELRELLTMLRETRLLLPDTMRPADKHLAYDSWAGTALRCGGLGEIGGFAA